MLDWLRRAPDEDPVVEIAGRQVPVMIRRLAHARRMTMRLAPDGSEIRISVPRWTRTEDALAFARAKQSWLAIQIEALPAAQPLADGMTLAFRGETLVVRHDASYPRKPVPDDGELLLGGPESSLPTRLKRWLETEARTLLTDDLEHYCAVAGQAVPGLGLSSANRRWGSCAADGSIRINWRLIMAPDSVRRSVVAHEVAHLVHFDHSPAFHAFLAKIFEGSVPSANRWLKENGRSLYVPFG
ncbi:SprT family zinc-dependent metalloprotease [Novosphingobium sp. BL-8H]|uniref:M48 family metallopeptidase n=1 Tax=Novosphingobium sp. BL-8H TaxID=3127640 RepID=UPI0037566F23